MSTDAPARPAGSVNVHTLPPFMADHGYPVSGDLIALHLHDSHPQNVSVAGRPLSRVTFGDLLWPTVAAMPHPGRR